MLTEATKRLRVYCNSIYDSEAIFNVSNVSSVLDPTVTFWASFPSTCPSGCATTFFLAANAAAFLAGSISFFAFLTLTGPGTELAQVSIHERD